MAVQMAGFKRVKRGYKPLVVENLVGEMKPGRDPTDPYFQLQWYLKNTGQNGGKARLDLNVEAAWAQGVTGKNVTTAIMDDGKAKLVSAELPLKQNQLQIPGFFRFCFIYHQSQTRRANFSGLLRCQHVY